MYLLLNATEFDQRTAHTSIHVCDMVTFIEIQKCRNIQKGVGVQINNKQEAVGCWRRTAHT